MSAGLNVASKVVAMPDEVAAALLGALGGLLTGGLAAFATLEAKGIDQEIENLKVGAARQLERTKLRVTTYDTKLLEERLAAYKVLWSLTKPTSRRRVETLDVDAAKKLAADLTDWYYDDGGLLLSAKTRDSFFTARRTLEARVQSVAETDDAVVDAFSALRTAICDDLTSRHGPTIGPDEEPPLP